MRIVRSTAMSLFTEREAQLVLDSAPKNLAELSARELRGNLKRARRLHGKYVDASRRQHREAVGKRTPTRGRRAEGNANTRRKAEFMEEAAGRFEKRLEVLDRKEAREKARAAEHKPSARRRAGASAVTRTRRASPIKSTAKSTAKRGHTGATSTAKRATTSAARAHQPGTAAKKSPTASSRTASSGASGRTLSAKRPVASKRSSAAKGRAPAKNASVVQKQRTDTAGRAPRQAAVNRRSQARRDAKR